MLGHYEPHGAEEVGEEQNEDYQAKHLEALDNEYLLHDLWIVNPLVVEMITLLCHYLHELFPVSLAHQGCELLQVHQDHDVFQAEQAEQEYQAELVFIELAFVAVVNRPSQARHQVKEESTSDVVLCNP